MWNWAKDFFDIQYPESPFQVGLYSRMFETILRMKGNFMWPASKSCSLHPTCINLS